MKLIGSIIFAITLTLGFITELIQYKRAHDFILNKKIFSISKHMMLKIIDIETQEKTVFYHDRKPIDNILAAKRDMFRCYLVGSDGLYIINRSKSTYKVYEDINSVPIKEQKHFKELLQENLRNKSGEII